ncbi:MAG: GNAT family N-acetyltransferase [Ignavibacteriaceae bacterium]|nr:GNAT family N-acetyltransferase [Ignavibacteriaceae bacterium]
MTEIRIIKHGSPEYEAEVALRDRVLRKPLGLVYTPEQLAAEKDEIHFNAFIDGKLAGCLLMRPLSADEIKMRQVAVDENFQRRGIGKVLVGHSEMYAAEHGFKLISLHSRDTAVEFYKSLGYECAGEGFTEVTIPHHRMIKKLY